MTSKDKAGRLLISSCTFWGRCILWATARGGCRSSLSSCEFGFCYEAGLNKMAYAGQG